MDDVVDLAPAAFAASTALSEPRITLQAWRSPAIAHGFMGRQGGVSEGAFATLNLARWVNDDHPAVTENWRWHSTFPGLKPVCLNQVHANDVWTVESDQGDLRPAADGMVTTVPGVALCIFTADCVPILLVDFERGVVGALHSGWRGTLANIAAAGVRAMVALGARPAAMRAALGPAIGFCCFEVDATLAERFAAELPESRAHARPGRRGKAHLDLRAIISEQLAQAGLDTIRVATIGPCTHCANDRYFSRRAAQSSVTGLQMSFVALQPRG